MRLWTVRLAGVLAGILTVLSVGSVTTANATENLDISEGGTLRLPPGTAYSPVNGTPSDPFSAFSAR